MSWRNASLRLPDEQPGWDTSIKGTGVVREDPLAVATWPAQQSRPEQPPESSAEQPAGPLQQELSADEQADAHTLLILTQLRVRPGLCS